MLSRLVRTSNLALRARSQVSTTVRYFPKRTYASLFDESPSPPKLSKEDQEEFERLQRTANSEVALEMTEEELEALQKGEATLQDKNKAMGYHPEYRPVYADFEGEKNPETGEIGGPKQDPLRHGDYSFNGRVTDF